MPEVKLRLQRFDSLEDATKVADDIRNAGTVSYTDNSGSTVNVTVGDVTVDNSGQGHAQQAQQTSEGQRVQQGTDEQTSPGTTTQLISEPGGFAEPEE